MYEELVCDALSDMLTDGSIVNFIAEVKAKDRNLGQKILDAIKSLLKKWGLIIDDYKGRELDTAEAQALSQFEDTFKKLQEMYRDAFMDANETYSVARNVLNGEVKNSGRIVDSKRKSYYNEYQTNAMQWAYSASTNAGDTKILSVSGKGFALIEATENGYIEIARGNYKEVLSQYEEMQRRADNSFYGYTQKIRAEKTGNMRTQFSNKRVGRDVAGNSRQTGSKKLQTGNTGNNEHLHSGDKGKSEKKKVNFSLRKDIDQSKIKRAYSLARSRDSRLIAEAEDYESQNKSRQFIFKKTGLVRDPKGVWLYELDQGSGGRFTKTYIVYDSSQLKTADPVTYDNEGNVIALSERFNSEKKDIRYSGRDSLTKNEFYSESQYNNFGWVRANNVLSALEYNTLLSRYADYKHNKDIYPTTRFGEGVIHSFDYPNVFIYVKGTIKNPQITKIVRITEDNSELVRIIREEILKYEYQQVPLPYQNVQLIFGEGILNISRKRDCLSFQEYKRQQERGFGKTDNYVDRIEQERARNSGKSAKIDEKHQIKRDDRDPNSSNRSILASAESEIKLSGRDELTNIEDDPLYPTNAREQSAFNRSIDNKTSDLKNTEKANIMIYTADYAYFVSANGYMSGKIVAKELIDGNEELINKLRKDFENGTLIPSEGTNSLIQSIRNDRRRGYRRHASLKETLAAEGYEDLDRESHSGNDRRSDSRSRKNSKESEIKLSERDYWNNIKSSEIFHSKKCRGSNLCSLSKNN